MKVLLLGFFCVLYLPNTYSDTLTTPFKLQLSKTSTTTLLSGVTGFKAPTGEYKTDLPNQTLTTPYATSINGIHLTLDYVFNTPVATSSVDEWTIQANTISANLVVDAINVSQTVVETSGGTTITLILTATCNNVKLALTPGATSMNATVDLALSGNHASYTLKDFTAAWTPAAWQVTSLNCQGPAGFTDQVKQSIESQLESINPFLPAIETQIQNGLNAQAANPIIFSVAATDPSGTSLTLVPDTIQPMSNGGAIMDGTATFNFAKLQNTNCQTQITDTPATPNAVDSLDVPLSAVKGLMQCAYLNGFFNVTMPSSQIPFFQSLLGNPILKLLVWPNLVKFNSSQTFLLNIGPTEAPTLGRFTSNRHGAIQFDFKAPLTLAIQAPEPTGPIPYVDLSTYLSGLAALTIQNGVLSVTQSTPGLKVERKWEPIYLDTYHPDQRIWTQVIGCELKKYLAKTGFTYTLPSLEAQGAYSASISSVSVNGDSASFSLAINAVSSTKP